MPGALRYECGIRHVGAKGLSLPSSPEGLSPPDMRAALGQLSLMLQANEPIPPVWAAWLGKALGKVGRGLDASRSLGLVQRTGRRKSVEAIDIATERGLDGSPAQRDEFPNLVTGEAAPRQNPTQEALAKKIHVDTRTIQRAEKAWREQIEKDRS